ncbi:exodeoxyribonuclease V subunit beta [Serratia microhaemolytica]|uniref:exodeoxyribonuclease V subunit beta n=1 Tax=Serratia microhaemolytica TaxID=2675110 RepID=UPI000FDE009C|nr:exodeoxyribonuclease V subunit beta [Serratia microhaemolytica]
MSDRLPLPLDALTLPLLGERLIEASAGTGKTFTIGLLYLRLLLGLGHSAAFSRPLNVEQILVVTFTEAATEELRGRIRSNIHQLRIACLRGSSNNPQFNALMAQIEHLPSAAALLLAAERQMDEAAIYTIHGFCQRMLAHNAFESGILFEQTLLQDEQPLRRQACADFWRRYCYPLPLPLARVVSREWSGPKALLATLNGYLHGEAPVLHPAPAPDETLEMRHQQLVARIDKVKTEWLAVAGELEQLISQSAVDKRSYSSKHLPNWLAKISQWAAQPTEDYTLPDELKRFGQTVLLEKTKKGTAPQHSLFHSIDQLYASPLSVRDLVLTHALQQVRSNITHEKRQRGELGFDDLLSRLDQALHSAGGEQLASTIRQRYPVAMIDEFQDTDPQQYRIFRRLYLGQPDCGLLLIGDPKQAIYAFRGADIFTYMQARAEVSAHYSMDTNWRSAPSMVNSVNSLFQQVASPFLFEQIPFIAVAAAEKNHQLSLEINGNPQPALQFWLQPGEGVSNSDYQQLMARLCAAQIRDWLSAGQCGEAWLNDGQQQRTLQAADITVLVRSRNEAALMRDALTALAIPSVYLSNRDSVFSTAEAKDLFWLLQAILAPEQERKLRTAIATALFGLDAATLEALNQQEPAWEALVNEFAQYRSYWLRRGVLAMLHQLMAQRNVAENLLATAGGERRLTDLLHLGELLQQAAGQLEGEEALLRWLGQQIAEPNPHADNQQLRLESDRHLVTVMTIHKSKGLEFNLVWLPFIASFRATKQALYHDRETFQLNLDISADPANLELAEQERLAEDLRLLYVALTRSVYHCSIGVAPLFVGQGKKQGNTHLHHGALGYLLQAGQAGDASYLADCLQRLAASSRSHSAQANSAIAVRVCETFAEHPWQPPAPAASLLAARLFARQREQSWRVTSYSGLQQQSGHRTQGLLPRLDAEVLDDQLPSEAEQLTVHTFPRGAAPGTFLHGLFEIIEFTEPLDQNVLLEQLQQHGFDQAWLPVLQQWMQTLLHTPLNTEGMRLAEIAPQARQAELQFYLPINQPLDVTVWNQLVKQHDPLSARSPDLRFQPVEGMLQGFIDLVFCWQGKYYLLDYKSNWLGEESSAYNREALEQAMIEHRYDLQYQLYTLALHRYLRHRLADYHYERHFGGVIYLFLRGVTAQQPGNGIFSCRPPLALIEAIDKLFEATAGATHD